MSLAEDVGAVRHSVGVSRLDHVSYLRVRGTRAYEALDAVVTAPLHIRDGQMLHTLLLSEDAHPIADIYLARDDEEFFLLSEGMDSGALVEHLRRHFPTDGTAVVEDRTATHAIVALDGPYAWELLGATVDPEGIGLPYLTFYLHHRWVCYRAGKTGEFGYGIIVPREELDDFERRVRDVGHAFDARHVGLDALDQCALENWFFNIRREGREPVTPLELQLQWRVSYKKDFVGSDALRRRRAEGPRERLTCILCGGPATAGDIVEAEGATIGRIVNAGYSDMRGEWMALALLDVAWAYPGIRDLSIRGLSGVNVRAHSVTPPVLQNVSLGVSPQLHSYATRHEFPAAPLVRR